MQVFLPLDVELPEGGEREWQLSAALVTCALGNLVKPTDPRMTHSHAEKKMREDCKVRRFKRAVM